MRCVHFVFQKEALCMCDCLSSVVDLVENATKVPDDLEYDCDKSALLTRTREVLHQLYKFGFEVIHFKITILTIKLKYCCY